MRLTQTEVLWVFSRDFKGAIPVSRYKEHYGSCFRRCSCDKDSGTRGGRIKRDSGGHLDTPMTECKLVIW